MSTALAPLAGQEVAMASRSQSLMDAISQASRDPQCDVAKMTAMHELFRQVVADEKKDLFDAAMARLQKKLPVIEKNKKGANGKYAPIEEIDARINPLLREEGFHFTFTSAPDPNCKAPKGGLLVTGQLHHDKGHTETAALSIALDTSGSKTDTQGAVSTVSYGIRALKRMMLDLTIVGEDRDGSPGKTITNDQVMTLDTMLGSIKDEPKGYRDAVSRRFFAAMAVSRLEDINAERFKEAVQKLEIAAKGPVK